MHHRFHLPIRGLLLPIAAALLVAGCQTAPGPQGHQIRHAAVASLAAAPVLRQDTFDLVYEIVSSARTDSVFVATIDAGDEHSAGFVHRLDPRTLQLQQTVQLPRRAYALGLNRQTGTLYVGHTKDALLSVLDAASGQVQGQIALAQPVPDAHGKVSVPNTRKVVVDEARNRLFVTSPGLPGLIWIVDGAKRTVTHTLASDGIWTAGAAYDAGRNRLYVSQGGVNEILAIDPDAGKIVQRWSTGDTQGSGPDDSKHFFVNLALDAQGQRLFATDASTNRLYVADIASGQFLRAVPIEGHGLLDVIFNPARNEIVTTSRGVSLRQLTGTGFVTVIDASTYAIKHRFDLPVHPNSLALSADGQSLYVTVKAARDARNPAYRKDAKDSVVRLDLNAL